MKIVLIQNDAKASERIRQIVSESKNVSVANFGSSIPVKTTIFETAVPLQEMLVGIKIDELSTVDHSDPLVIVINNDCNSLLTGNSNSLMSDDLIFNEIKILSRFQEVYVNQKRIIVTQVEYKLLKYFILNERKIILKKEIEDYLWQGDIKPTDPDNAIHSHIKNLKKKLTIGGSTNYITTVYGIGYKFEHKNK